MPHYHRNRRQPRDPNAAPAAPRKVATTHCQICGRPIFALTGVIAHHGYTRPYEGTQTASCWGARFLPYEESCDQIQPAINMITTWRTNAQAALDGMIAEPPASYRVEDSYLSRKGKLVYKEIALPDGFVVADALADWRENRGSYASRHSDYSSEYRHQHRTLTNRIAAMTHDIDYLTQRLAEWVAPTSAPEVSAEA